MPEQSVHHQEETDSDQQPYYNYELKGELYENHRHHRSGRIQRRN